MSLTKEQWIQLEKKASAIRRKTAEVCVWAKGAHIGGLTAARMRLSRFTITL